jgi:hypothetical protein
VGREILYCTKCGKALNADDFTRGRAHTYDNRQFCTPCLPPRRDPAPTPRPAKRAPSSSRGQPAPPPPKRSPLPWVLGGAAVFAAVLGVVLLRPAPPPPEDPALKILQEARDFARANAKSPEDVARRWEQAVAATGGHPDAKRELDRALAARKEAETRELKELDDKTRERVQAEQFGAVSDVLEEARKRHDSPDWAKGIEDRVKALKATTDERYPALKSKAAAAQARGALAEVAELRTKLSLWGRKDLGADLEAELAKIVPKEEPPAGAAVLFRFPKDAPRGYNLTGPLKDGALVSSPWGKESLMGGFEVIREPFAIPEKGEFWLTFSTKSDKPVALRFRVIRGDKTQPYNWTVEKPDVGRPTRVKAPLRDFMNYDNKFIGVGDRVNSIYIQQDDPKAELTFYEAVIFRAP